jgi:adenylate kinase family enzyme
MKILIIGNGGTGKSTLAQKMGAELNIAVTYLDLIMWNKNWDRLPEREFTKRLAAITPEKDWIIEGWGYHSTLNQRIEKADVIIYLQFPLEFCLKSVLERNKKYNNKKNPFDPFEDDRLSNQSLFEEAIRIMHKDYEPELRRWLSQWEFSLKKIFVFKSRAELGKGYNEMLKSISKK